MTFDLGIQLEKRIGSKWPIEQLQRLGYFISCDEVMHYKQDAVDRSPQMSLDNDGAFLPWVADNLDHNQVPLTGKDTFHGMGVISITANGQLHILVMK